MKIIVVAPRGKMGKLITQAAASREDLELVAGLGPKGRDYIGEDLGTVAMTGRTLGVPVTDDLESVIDRCDAIIDFSTGRYPWKSWQPQWLTKRRWCAAPPAFQKMRWPGSMRQLKPFPCCTPPTPPSWSM